MNKAEKQGKTAMIYFYVEHCPACRMFEKYVFANETVIKKSREFICIKVKENENLTEKYNVRTYPTILFIRSGEEIDRIEGYNGDVDSFLNAMDKTMR
ncbi:MAG: thioredoxin family protein [Thermoplasmata archaeon]|nr:thioredoxin family protein [Thermoplasmata archaeon]